MRVAKSFAAAVALLVASFGSAAADQVNVAVAANFTDAAKEIGKAFQAKTGDAPVFSFGSTGQLYTQISQGAPFQVFLAADTARPEKAVAEGLGVDGSLFTYATGKLVVWTKKAGLTASEETLKAGDYNKLSICDPKAAPYGKAAVEALQSMQLYEPLRPKLVQGANITQAFQFVDTGNAEIGFVALSQVVGKSEGSQWIVPQNLYNPLKQDAVLLKKGADSAAAKAFMDFLKGPEAQAIIRKYGYDTGD